jgi:hypothetical protein
MEWEKLEAKEQTNKKGALGEFDDLLNDDDGMTTAAN